MITNTNTNVYRRVFSIVTCRLFWGWSSGYCGLYGNWGSSYSGMFMSDELFSCYPIICESFYSIFFGGDQPGAS